MAIQTELKYFHEIPQSEVQQLLDDKRDWGYVMENYIQPEWCDYTAALNGRMGCWSLTDLSEGGTRKKISHEFCKGCDCYKPKSEPCLPKPN